MNIKDYFEQHPEYVWDKALKEIIKDDKSLEKSEENTLITEVKTNCDYASLTDKEVKAKITNLLKEKQKETEKLVKLAVKEQKLKERRENLPKWAIGMDISEYGYIDSSSNNRILYENHDFFKGKFIYDEIRQEELFDGKPLTDTVLADIKIRTEEILKGNRTATNVKSATLSVCNSHKINPLKNKLYSLRGTWDGKKRLETLFIKAFECDDTLYIRESTKQFFYAWIHRILDEPTCQFDMMYMFEGKQGIGKSKFLARMINLIGGKSVDGMKFNDDRTTKEKLSSNQLCQFDELGNISRTELDFIKEFITRDSDSYDKKYRSTETYPRHCMLVGSLNPDKKHFLRDVAVDFERRFIIIPCHAAGTAEMPIKSEDWWWKQQFPDDYLLQVWAEAMYLVENEPDFNWSGWSKERMQAAKEIQKDYSCINSDDILINELLELFELPFYEDSYYNYESFKIAVENGKNSAIAKPKELKQIKCAVLRQYIEMVYKEKRSITYFDAVMKRLGWEKKKTSMRIDKNGIKCSSLKPYPIELYVKMSDDHNQNDDQLSLF